jgi:uncharacterized membrane protein YidH (DUF202 family)
MGGLGILLLAIGAVMAFATTVTVEGFDIETIGIILMAVGVLAIVLATARGRFWGFSTRTERTASPDGTHIVEQTHTDG